MAIEQNSIITASDMTDVLRKIGIRWKTTQLLSTTDIFGSSIALSDSVTNYDFISIRLCTGSNPSTEQFGPYSYMPCSEWSNHNSTNGSGIRVATGGSYLYSFRFNDSSHLKYYSGNVATCLIEIYGHKLITSYTEQTQDILVPSTVTCLYSGQPDGTITLSESYMNYNFLSISAYYTQAPCFIDSKLIPCAVINSLMTMASNRIELTSESDYFAIYFPTLTQMTLYSSSLGSKSNKYLYIYGVK